MIAASVIRALSKPREIPAALAHALLIALMMEAASVSKTLVNFYQITRRNIPEDRLLQFYL
jgi:hypothetical protein